jgi:serine/threonine-protein kinase HipA
LKNALGVWWDDVRVGLLMIDEHGEMEFAYDPAWLQSPNPRPISYSLPLQADVFSRRQARPFFAGLLPEANIRKSVARALGISEKNDFGLLKRLGGDVAGALTLWPDDDVMPDKGSELAQAPLGDNELIDLLDTLPKRPFLAGEGERRLSLAGAQNKLPVVLVDGRVALPAPGQATTHILKPAIRDLPYSTENEACVMQLASAVGLDVAPAVPMMIKDRTFLLVTRYDRDVGPDGRTYRVHQEDLCQALSISPEHKYSAEGGPTFKTSFALLREMTTRPAIELLKFMDAAIFNLIVGNADAHGKNFSLLYKHEETVLAPLYDLMCTAVYPDVSTTLAMTFSKASDLEEFSPKVWERFAADVEISPTYIRKRVRDLSNQVDSDIRTVTDALLEKGFDADGLRKISDLIQARGAAVNSSA